LAAERSLAGMLEEVSDERVFVAELDAANVAAELLLTSVDLKKENNCLKNFSITAFC
jgi:hypothetical protein